MSSDSPMTEPPIAGSTAEWSTADWPAMPDVVDSVGEAATGVFRRDQAAGLRSLVERFEQTSVSEPSGETRCRTLSVAGGKGGVGKTIIALNLAIALAESGQRVALLDGNLGLGNLDLLCGLNGYWNLTHVVAGARNLEDVILKAPGGVDLIPGAGGLADAADLPTHVQRELLLRLKEIEGQYDWLMIDTGSGIHRLVRNFVAAGKTTLLVSTLEPTSLADAYATVKSFAADGHSRIQLVLNRVHDTALADHAFERLNETSRLFLRQGIQLLGRIPEDPAVSRSVHDRRPMMIVERNCPAAKSMRRLAEKLIDLPSHAVERTSFFEGFWQRFRTDAA